MHIDVERKFIARRLSRALLSFHKSRIKATEENENVNLAFLLAFECADTVELLRVKFHKNKK